MLSVKSKVLIGLVCSVLLLGCNGNSDFKESVKSGTRNYPTVCIEGVLYIRGYRSISPKINEGSLMPERCTPSNP